jgi:hypothetical protein
MMSIGCNEGALESGVRLERSPFEVSHLLFIWKIEEEFNRVYYTWTRTQETKDSIIQALQGDMKQKG